MLVTMHQPEHLPWLGFFHKMAQADLYVVMDDFQYCHQYFQNRNRIQGVQAPIWVTVPVRKERHRYGPIAHVCIDNSRDWRRTYWRSIEYHYHKHPFFDRYAADLHDILMAPWEHLVDLNLALIAYFRQALAIDTPMLRASSIEGDRARGERILEVAQALGTTCYLSGPCGRDYLDETPFLESGIRVEYHAFAHPSYEQRGKSSFTPFLSVLDLLMNCGSDSRRILLDSDPLPLSRVPLIA